MSSKNNIDITLPFLRWAGSKKCLLSDIKRYLPAEYNNYYEPFMGSGALFFSISQENRAFYLSDLNQRLMNVYIQIRDNVDDVIGMLKAYKNEEQFYYYIRKKEVGSLIEEAAIFIFLNKTCYNGLYRVNSKDEFNVPYGRRKNVDYISEEVLKKASIALRNVHLDYWDFENTFAKIQKNDLVFIDPPYTTAHNDNGFIEYNQKIFDWNDQIRLHDYIKRLHDIGAYFILTNAAHQSIRELYSDICEPIELERRSHIGGKNSYRGIVKEYLFVNTQ